MTSLENIERYYDDVPRAAARVEEFGPLRLFVRENPGFPYYARPAGSGGEASVADVDKVRARQRELGVPEAFEWVAEVTPGLRAAVEGSGLTVSEHPLMVLAGEPGPAADTPDAEVRVLAADDPALALALAATHVAFGASGSQQEIADRLTADGAVEVVAAGIRSGRRIVAAAVTADGQALCGGSCMPLEGVAEIGGVGTVPAARRRGLAYAVTRALAVAAGEGGVHTLFLSAEDEAVARMYARLGFVPLATALIAEAGEGE
ncbi:GNAT family N-acetyltransferase [Streptomyces sp. NPDC051940]|uniref:GNAT family N-acetyltransferase n=1 Tax=Streptomyces sp. NPDC051940 TaxID=3155675 RepID=UPI00343097C3